jgi:antitoxin MazE
MSHKATLSKWGNSLAVRIPLAIARQASLDEGDSVQLGLAPDGSIVLRPARKRYELTDHVAGITAGNRHDEVDWGAAQGKESW